MRLLLVEDDDLLGTGLRTVLRRAGYATDWVRTGNDASLALRTHAYEAVLLDLGLPDGDGLAILESLRAGGSQASVIVISARDQLQVRIRALDQGADDYLIKPFDNDELLARLRSTTRRGTESRHATLTNGPLCVDLTTRQVTMADVPVELAAREYEVLVALLTRRGQVLTIPQLEETIYDWDADIGSNAIQVHIHYLRRKLGEHVIRTVRGHGYVMDALA